MLHRHGADVHALARELVLHVAYEAVLSRFHAEEVGICHVAEVGEFGSGEAEGLTPLSEGGLGPRGPSYADLGLWCCWPL